MFKQDDFRYNSFWILEAMIAHKNCRNTEQKDSEVITGNNTHIIQKYIYWFVRSFKTFIILIYSS